MELPRFRGHIGSEAREEGLTMARTHQAYPPEFRQQMVELVQAGRTPQELAREYEPSAGTIRNWVAQHERDGVTISQNR